MTAVTRRKNAVCNTCTRRLVVIAYRRSPWFRLVREPLKLAMHSWVRLSSVSLGDYEVRSPGCNNCMRFYKTILKENSAIFRLLNKMVNPVFDTILERIVSKEEVDKAEVHAQAAIAGEALPHDGDRFVSDPSWWRI